MSYDPLAPIPPEWCDAIRSRVTEWAIDPQLVRGWLAIECRVTEGSHRLEQLTQHEAVHLYRQLNVWRRRSTLVEQT